MVRLYGLRHWVEQGYKQMKDQLGWADFMVRSDRAIRRHWVLVCCAFAFCWWQEARQVRLHNRDSPPMREKKPARAFANALPLATPAALGAGMADTAALAHALLAGLFRQAPACRNGSSGGIPYRKRRNQPLSPSLTNYH